ncbi:MAG: AAA family ATPase [Gammaproteobacteria bacterium]|nr:AAA family ATPase [Gammaproteobacteria bacterium]
MKRNHQISPDMLRWQVNEENLKFTSTREVKPVAGIVGQPVALEALKFGLECQAPGQNVYVRGITGTGRMTMIRSLLDELDLRPWHQLDRCYVHNFKHPDQPRLITLPRGEVLGFRQSMERISDFIDYKLKEFLNTAPLKARREAVRQKTQNKINKITKPFEQDLKKASMALVNMQAGPSMQTVICPVVDNESIMPDQYALMHQEGKVSDEDFAIFEKRFEEYNQQIQEISEQVSALYQKGLSTAGKVNEDELVRVLIQLTKDLRTALNDDNVNQFLDEVIADILEYRLTEKQPGQLPAASVVYGVNVITSCDDESPCPVVIENLPTVSNLFGSIESHWVNGNAMSDYRSIRAGSIVHADGGYLVLDALDVLREPDSWRSLMRALRTEQVDIVPADSSFPFNKQSLNPQPIGINLRVILLGSHSLYYQLDQLDPDFSDLFKVLVDFDTEIERNERSIEQYAGVIARLVRDEGLRHFERGAIGALAEHGARIASRKGKITARFGRIADIAREASYLAEKADSTDVNRSHIEETVKRTKYRASLPSRRFQELIDNKTIWVPVDGQRAGQINGLAVIQAGNLMYGFPARITATIGAGTAGVINIEDRAAMSGAIHTKGFQILGGLIRHLLRTDHPLAFSASVTFEQSYGGIDGDSASGAEICCLLSALTSVPLKQSIAMTGAIDQHGRVQAIGGVNEKIEGFFDTCNATGLTGDQGVIIPTSNAGDLMLRQDVVLACSEDRFHIYSVERIEDALQLLTGIPTGELDENGDYPEASLLALAKRRALEFWRKTLVSPASLEGG